MNTRGRPPSPPKTRLGEIVRAARESLGMTQREFAHYLGAPKSLISNMESQSEPRTYPAALERIARIPGVDPDELWTAAGRIPPDLEARIAGNLDAVRKVRECLS